MASESRICHAPQNKKFSRSRQRKLLSVSQLQTGSHGSLLLCPQSLTRFIILLLMNSSEQYSSLPHRHILKVIVFGLGSCLITNMTLTKSLMFRSVSIPCGVNCPTRTFDTPAGHKAHRINRRPCKYLQKKCNVSEQKLL